MLGSEAAVAAVDAQQEAIERLNQYLDESNSSSSYYARSVAAMSSSMQHLSVERYGIQVWNPEPGVNDGTSNYSTSSEAAMSSRMEDVSALQRWRMNQRMPGRSLERWECSSWAWEWYACTSARYALVCPLMKPEFLTNNLAPLEQPEFNIGSATQFAACLIAASQAPLHISNRDLPDLSDTGFCFLERVCAPRLTELVHNAVGSKQDTTIDCDVHVQGKQEGVALAYFDGTQRLSIEVQHCCDPMAEVLFAFDYSGSKGSYFDWEWNTCANTDQEMPEHPYSKHSWEKIPIDALVQPAGLTDGTSWHSSSCDATKRERGLRANDLLLLFDEEWKPIPVIVRSVHYHVCQRFAGARKVRTHMRWRIRKFVATLLQTDVPSKSFSLRMAVGVFLQDQKCSRCHLLPNMRLYEQAFAVSPKFCMHVLGGQEAVEPLDPQSKMADWASHHDAVPDVSPYKAQRAAVANGLKDPCTVIRFPPGKSTRNALMSILESAVSSTTGFRCLILAKSDQAVEHSVSSLLDIVGADSDRLVLIRANHRLMYDQNHISSGALYERSVTLELSYKDRMSEALNGGVVQFFFMTLGLSYATGPVWVNLSCLLHQAFDVVLVQDAATTMLPEILHLPVFLKKHGSIILVGKSIEASYSTSTFSAIDACMRINNIIDFHNEDQTVGMVALPNSQPTAKKQKTTIPGC